ncbi:Linear gramicidin synthase subunit B [Streptomyces sp. RB17]|uniref:non-ribosomal peptide synthetase n=1 Tax=Streptomyces sp. RB17 TaxID=2585197 RepID=UPI00130A023A|nr:non-ribosomal peptide synthetase [Streptomyces sp. RB17]MQY33684.1 Linear gramicidin synthase subunit B [Streptomyces sp. RB17]
MRTDHASSAARSPVSLTLTDCFDRIVRTAGHEVALVSGTETVTFRELNERAERVARALVARKVAPGDRVAVYLRRSTDLYAVMLGVLKAAACVVPLNPDHPAPFVSRVVAESAPRAVVHDTEPPGAAPTTAGAPLHVPVDELTRGADPGSDMAPPAVSDPESTAFLMFTSGSTGRPKGVRIAHRGLARLGPYAGDLRMGPGDCLVQSAAFSFAASTIEIWLAFLHGARLVVMPHGLPSLPALKEAIVRHGVTALSLPCGLFNLLVDEEPECLRDLRVILLSGDFPSPEHLRRAARSTQAVIYNGYGCTENSSITALHPIRGADDVPREERVPVGRPLPEVDLEVLDDTLRPCPPGTPGQLTVGGLGLAQGYLDDPELTARKFVTGPDGRLRYLTGDLARTTADGDIVLVGRADSMVKIRGYRVELTAVTLALRALDGVTDAVVKAFPEDAGDKSLTAFYTTTDGRPRDGADLARLLGDELPSYMVPSSFHHLGELPRNVNGKIDRSALTDPSVALPKPKKGDAAVQNPLETVVLQAWKDISGAQDFTTTDSFLGHGGNSLHFVQLASRLQKIFGVEVSTEDVFRHGTVEQLARFVEQARDTGRDPAAQAQQS